jgi:hypothetical protein
MPPTPLGRRPVRRRRSPRRTAAVGLTLVTLAAGGLACSGQDVSASYPEVTAGSVPDSDDATSTTLRTGTSRGSTTTSRGSSTTRSGATTTRGGGPTTKNAPNPQYASYCEQFIAKLGAAFASKDEDEQLAEAQDALLDLAAIAPDPIKLDMATYAAYAQTVDDPDDMSSSNLPADIKAVDKRLDDWHSANCGM